MTYQQDFRILVLHKNQIFYSISSLVTWEEVIYECVEGTELIPDPCPPPGKPEAPIAPNTCRIRVETHSIRFSYFLIL